MDGPYGPGFGFWWGGFVSVGLMAALGAGITGAHIAAGIAILQRREWGRILGMVVSGAALVLVFLAAGASLPSMLILPPSDSGMGNGWDQYYAATTAVSAAFGIIVAVLAIIGYGFVLWTLARRGEVFE